MSHHWKSSSRLSPYSQLLHLFLPSLITALFSMSTCVSFSVVLFTNLVCYIQYTNETIWCLSFCLTYSICRISSKSTCMFLQINKCHSPFLLDAEQHLFTLAELEGSLKGPCFLLYPLLSLQPFCGSPGRFCVPSWNSLHTRTLRCDFTWKKCLKWCHERRGVGSGPEIFFSLLECVLV